MSATQPAYYMDIYSEQSGRTYIDLEWTSGASGAVPAALTRATGITSVVHGATGIYTVTFDDAWVALLGISSDIQQATYSATGACFVKRTATAISTPGTRTVTLLVVDGAAGAAVQPAAGDVISMTFCVQLLQAT